MEGIRLFCDVGGWGARGAELAVADVACEAVEWLTHFPLSAALFPLSVS